MTRTAGQLVALAILDLALLAAGAMGLPAGIALAGHAVGAALGYAAWIGGGAPVALAPAIAGVLGPLGILAALPLTRYRPRPRDDNAMFGHLPDPVARRTAGLAVARMLDGRVRYATPDTLGSLVTIMRHGDVAARRRALETVVRSFEPALSPLIALALTDGDQTIRALAAAASARVADNLGLARGDLAARRDTGADPDAGIALAALLADHARADVLLSDSQRTHLRADAVAAIATAAPADPDARAAIAIEALWAAGDYDAIDRLVATMPEQDRTASWWRAASAA